MARGSDRILIVMIAGFSAAVLAGLVALALLGNRGTAEFSPDSPQWVVQRYLKALEEGKWEEAYSYLAESAKDEDLERSYKRDHVVSDDSSRRILLEKSETKNGEAEVIVSISTFRSSGPIDTSEYTHRINFLLKREGEQWKIVNPTYPPFLGRSPAPPRPALGLLASASMQTGYTNLVIGV